MLRVLIVLAACFAGSASAQVQHFLSADGALFAFKENRHGVVLTAIEKPDDLLIDPVASTPVSNPGDIIYLGRGCDSFSRKLGNGRWQSLEGGFLVQFRGAEVVFPGQQIDAGRGVNCTRER